MRQRLRTVGWKGPSGQRMWSHRLLASTGMEPVDRILEDVVRRVEHAFPDRIRAHYLVGSHACGEAVPTSDVDVVAVFKGSVASEERRRFALVRAECRRASALQVDLTTGSETTYRQRGAVWFQTVSRLLHGEDIRSTIPRRSIADHARDLMHATVPLLARVRGASRLTLPLSYPDPSGTFLGYDRQPLRFADGTAWPSTKDLVLNVLGAANVLTLVAAQRYVGGGRKSDVAEQYRIWVGDEWADLVEEVYHRCRNRWTYQIPGNDVDRRRLRELCQRALSFENHFLERYRRFVLAELQHPDPAIQRFAARRLGLTARRRGGRDAGSRAAPADAEAMPELVVVSC